MMKSCDNPSTDNLSRLRKLTEELSSGVYDARPRRLLLVEDDTDTRELLTIFLTKQGYEVDSAKTISDACKELATETVFDVILLDVNLPNGSGLSILDDLKVYYPRTKVIIITGAPLTLKDQVQAFSQGAVCWIQKPVRLDALVRRIERYI